MSASAATHRLMAVGAHADDLELQIGGTLAKYHEIGYAIDYVMATNNMSGSWGRLREDGTVESTRPPAEVIRPQRRKEAEAGARALGTEPVYLDHPQRHFMRQDGTECELRFGCERPAFIPPDVPTILTGCEDAGSIRRLSELILERAPEAVITHGMPMVNPEHFCTSVLVLRAYREAVERGYEGLLLLWPDLGIWDYGEAYRRWDTFVDISAYWDRKLELCALHACQKPDLSGMDWPPNGPACGCLHAEVFTIAGRGRTRTEFPPFTLEIVQHLR